VSLSLKDISDFISSLFLHFKICINSLVSSIKTGLVCGSAFSDLLSEDLDGDSIMTIIIANYPKNM